MLRPGGYGEGMSIHEGGCHCGRVRYRVRGALAGVTECNCSICAKKGYLHWIVPRDAFELVAGEDALATYRFHTGVAQHKFCRDCGVASFYVPRSDPDKIDVNVRCLDGVDPAQLSVSAFDGQHWETSMSGPVPWRATGPELEDGPEAVGFARFARARLVLVATLGVRKEALEQFRAYENTAARVMRRYGGAIARTVALPPGEGPLLEEIHLVTFPDQGAFAAYQRDAEIVAAAPLREAAIATTRVVIGAPGPRYG
jgi:uncharacterized protein (DUF1330 family)